MFKLFFSILFVVTTIQTLAKDLTEEQYWARTSLKITHTRFLINDVNCNSSKDVFNSCLESLNTMSSFLKGPEDKLRKLILPDELQKSDLVIGRPGGLVLVESQEVRTENMTANEIKNKLNELRTVHFRAVEQAFGTTKIEFNSLFSVFAKMFAGKENESFIAASALNSYYQSGLDPHSRIQPWEQLKMDSKESSYTGIGVSLRIQNGKVLIEDFVPNSPAAESSLSIGDEIVKINGAKLNDSISEVISKIKGPENTTVSLEVMSKGETHEIKIKRVKLVAKTVESTMIGSVGYIKLKHFLDPSGCQKILDFIRDFEKQGMKGLILDLKNNGGGLLTQGVCIGALFLGTKTTIVTEKFLDEKTLPVDFNYEMIRNEGAYDTKVDVPANGLEQNYPVIVLINSRSASAAELVAGALQDANANRNGNRFWIVGDTSFGKGSVQQSKAFFLGPYLFPSIAKFETIARFYQPSGRTNQIVGIKPDFYVDPTPEATDEDKFTLREDEVFKNALPPKLEKQWSQPYPEYVTMIESCMAKGRAKESYAQEKLNHKKAPDYRLLVAQDIMQCILENPM